MMFPVVCKTRVFVEPAESIYYLVAENGVFEVRKTALHRAVNRVAEGIPGLLPEHEHLCLEFPRLGRALVEEVLAFFQDIYQRYRGEAVVVLLYRRESREFRVAVPPQTLSGRRRDGRWLADLGVLYKDIGPEPGFLRAGTIHSHAQLPAYASGQDCLDEQYEDGLHIVFGSFAARALTVAASFVSKGNRFLLDPTEVLEPFSRPAHASRPEWMARVRPGDRELPMPREGDDHENEKASRP